MGFARLSDVPPPYELQRQDAQRAHDRLGQFQRSVNEAAIKGGDAALRAALLINGGAAVSVLAFIGGLAAQDRIKLDQLKAVADSLMLFAFGVVAAVVGMGLAYLTNLITAIHAGSVERLSHPPYLRPGKNTATLSRMRNSFHAAAVVATLASIALFVWGMFDVRNAISGLK